MTLYTIKWTETHHHEVDIDAVGDAEALEEFWSQYHDASGARFWNDSQTEIDGPNDVLVTWRTAVITIPNQKQENP